MELNFCTLFDSSYFSRGLSLYFSLLNQSINFNLYVLAMDDKAYSILNKLNLQNIILVNLVDFEEEELLKVKNNRTRAEYCWTLTPLIIKYCTEKYNLSECTYLDADLYFFNNPLILFEEVGRNSVLITEHRYTPKYDQSKANGKYCVQFMTFKNNEYGMKVLNWWRDRCIEWCYARHEDGKFGDQKYLDDWMTRFESVHELQHLGGGVAPWNMTQYQYRLENDQVILNANGKDYPLVFFHFHALKIYNDKYDLGIYDLNDDIVNLIYKPYLKHLEEIDKKLRSLGYDFNWHAKSQFDATYKGKLSRFKRILKRRLHIYTKEEMGIYG